MTGERPSPALLLETLIILIGASLAVRLMRFPQLIRLLSRQTGGSTCAPVDLVASLRRALEAWSRRLPWRTLCFEQGVSAHWLLGRRGFRSTLSYGAAMVDGELKAHVWVMSGEIPVIGCDNAADFALLSRFSNDSSS